MNAKKMTLGLALCLVLLFVAITVLPGCIDNDKRTPVNVSPNSGSSGINPSTAFILGWMLGGGSSQTHYYYPASSPTTGYAPGGYDTQAYSAPSTPNYEAQPIESTDTFFNTPSEPSTPVEPNNDFYAADTGSTSTPSDFYSVEPSSGYESSGYDSGGFDSGGFDSGGFDSGGFDCGGGYD